jgi:DUF1680 family protein
MKAFISYLALGGLLLFSPVYAQDSLYPNTFPLGDVTLLDGPFKNARDLNTRTLLQYDVDRFLVPYLKVSGLTPKANNYPNWESGGLDGHVGGYYLTAMAMNYAATDNSECKKRMEHRIAELKARQKAIKGANAPQDQQVINLTSLDESALFLG